MQISLLSRFQGVLVGAAVADILGACRQPEGEKPPPLSWLDSQYWRSGGPPPCFAPAWGGHWVQGLNDWIESDGQNWNALGQSYQAIKLGNPAASAIALLPLILVAHDDHRRQRRALAAVIHQAAWDSAALLAALIVATGINLALQNRLVPGRLIAHLSEEIKRLGKPIENSSDSDGQWFEPAVLSEALNLLQWIQTLIRRPVGLEAAAAKLPEISAPFGALGLALYCFLSAPEEYGLTVIRALRCSDQSQLAATLAGALAGAYNGLGGVPIAWRLGIQHSQTGPAAISMLWRIPSETVLHQLSEVLLAVWAGGDKQFVQSIHFQHPIHSFEGGDQ